VVSNILDLLLEIFHQRFVMYCCLLSKCLSWDLN
jgi:hypothetical protein